MSELNKWDSQKREKIIQGIIRLGQRSEDQKDSLVLETFYDYNITPYLMNTNNQIIQGSRGTGKTHILRVLEKTLPQKIGELTHCIYLDCRQIGSSIGNGLNNNKEADGLSLNPPSRFFQYFLERIYKKIEGYYSYQYYNDDPILKEKVYALLSKLKGCTITINEVVQSASVVDQEGNNSTESSSLFGELSLFKSFDLRKNKERKKGKNLFQEKKQEIKYNRSFEFPKFGIVLDELLNMTNTRIFLLLDEWSSIPWDIQPYLAEFLRKTLFPVSRVKFKIAVVPQRTQLRSTINGQKMGLEVGADIQMAIDLDRVYSIDNSPRELFNFCFRFICKHLSALLATKIEASEFIQNMLADERCAFLLVRSSEGNPRDFINMTFSCVQNTLGADYVRIDESKIIPNSKTLFEGSKLRDCDEHSRQLLDQLINFVVYQKRYRGFLIDRDKINQSHALKGLIDARVIHILKENYIGYDKAMSRNCSLLILNFGAYSDILWAGKPINLFWGSDILEKSIFPPKEHILYSDELLPYDENRKFYVCYLDVIRNEQFTPFFYG